MLDIGGMVISVEEFEQTFTGNSSIRVLGLEGCKVLLDSIHMVESGVMPR